MKTMKIMPTDIMAQSFDLEIWLLEQMLMKAQANTDDMIRVVCHGV